MVVIVFVVVEVSGRDCTSGGVGGITKYPNWSTRGMRSTCGDGGLLLLLLLSSEGVREDDQVVPICARLTLVLRFAIASSSLLILSIISSDTSLCASVIDRIWVCACVM